ASVFWAASVEKTLSWSVPNPLSQPDDGLRLAIAYGELETGLGISWIDGDDAGDLVTFDAFVDFGAAVAGLVHTADEWLILRCQLGIWAWPDSPDKCGFTSGVALGLGFRPYSMQFGWTVLHDVAGDSEVRFMRVGASVYF
ncbi:MAG: hypothetical protein ACYSU0_19490, partial [Planctomycetota bacterium]